MNCRSYDTVCGSKKLPTVEHTGTVGIQLILSLTSTSLSISPLLGVYFAKEGNVSTGSYARAASSCWRNSASRITSCVGLAEIVNLPSKFKSTHPFFVVEQTDWIIW